MIVKAAPRQQYINVESVSAFINFTNELHELILKGMENGCTSLVFVCIGTDRSTGDSLGPLVGYKIRNVKRKNVFVYGDLDNPVHAKNLETVMNEISAACPKPYIIAIDACLGRMDHVGFISIGEGSIKPGSGVNKELLPVGDMYVTGIVNFGGFMDFLVLQNTRLSVVMKMADLMATGIRFVLWKLNDNIESAVISE